MPVLEDSDARELVALALPLVILAPIEDVRDQDRVIPGEGAEPH
jgi:hypothetical protein